jgi:hypothetical protein
MCTERQLSHHTTRFPTLFDRIRDRWTLRPLIIHHTQNHGINHHWNILHHNGLIGQHFLHITSQTPPTTQIISTSAQTNPITTTTIEKSTTSSREVEKVTTMPSTIITEPSTTQTTTPTTTTTTTAPATPLALTATSSNFENKTKLFF